MSPEEDRELDERIATLLDAEHILSALTNMDEVQRERLAQSLSRFMVDRAQMLRKPENFYTPQWAKEDQDINHTSPTEFYKENVAGHQGPTLPRRVNVWGNVDMWLTRNDPQELNLRFNGGGAMDCVPDHIIVECYADLVTAGTHVEGQTFTSLGGCTFRMWSNMTQTMATAIEEEEVVIICPGVYEMAGVTIDNACTIMGITPVDWSGTVSQGFTSIDRAELHGTDAATLISFTDATGASYSVANILFRPSSGQTAININSSNNGTRIKDSAFIVSATGTGLNIDGVFGKVEGCWFQDGIGINFAGGTSGNWQVSGSHFDDCVSAIVAGEGTLVENCTFDNCTIGIEIQQTTHDNLYNNLYFSNSATCLKSSGGPPFTHYLISCTNWKIDLCTTVIDVSHFSQIGGQKYGWVVDNITGTLNAGGTVIKWPSSATGLGGLPIMQSFFIGLIHMGSDDTTSAINFESGARPTSGRLIMGGPINVHSGASGVAAGEELETIGGSWDQKATARVWYIASGGSNPDNAKIGCTAFIARFGDTITSVSRQETTLTAGAGTHYIEVDSAGTLSDNTSAFTAGRLPLCIATTIDIGDGIATLATVTSQMGIPFQYSSTPPAGYAPSPHAFVGTHHTGDDDYTLRPNVLALGVGGAAGTRRILFYSDAGSTLTASFDAPIPQLVFGSASPSGLTAVRDARTFTDPASQALQLDTSAVANYSANSAASLRSMTGVNTLNLASGITLSGSQIAQIMGWTITAAGASTASTVTGWTNSFTVGTDATVTTLRALNIINAAGGGTVDTFYGIDIAAITKGTLNVGIRNAATMRQIAALTVGADAAVTSGQIASITGNVGISAYTRVGSLTAPTNTTAGDLTATRLIVPDAAIVHSAITQLGGPVVIPAAGAMRFSDTDNSHYTGLAANGTTTSTVTYTLPAADGTSGQVLKTNASGVMSWGDVAHGNVSTTSMKQTLVLMAGSGSPTTTTGCAAVTTVEAGTNDIDYKVLDFDTGSDEMAFWNIVMPDNYDASVDMIAVFYWTAASGSGTVEWAIQALALNESDAIDTAYGTAVTVNDTLTTAGDIHITSATSGFAPGGTDGAGRPFFFRVYRDVSADTLAVDARLIGVKIEYGITALSA